MLCVTGGHYNSTCRIIEKAAALGMAGGFLLFSSPSPIQWRLLSRSVRLCQTERDSPQKHSISVR